ncbi:MAG: hypothetical protein AB7G62_01325 [Magnetospirillum sp.]
MDIEEIIAALRECRKLIPGPGHPDDGAAADYLIERLRGEIAGGMRDSADPVAIPGLGQSDPVILFHHGQKPCADDIW